jgi:hypothetical protein
MFNIVAIVVFFILGVIWSKIGWTNLIIKIGFFALFVWGAFDSGIVVQL